LYKLIGAIAGGMMGGIFGAFLGYFLGSVIGRFMDYGIGAINPMSTGQRQTVFLETVFVLMGKLAKADGHISQDEINHVEQFMQKMGMSAEHKKQAISLFKQGSSPDYDIEPKLNEFVTICGHTNNLRQILLTYLIVMALADGQLDVSEENLLRHVASKLGYNEIAFRQLLDMILNQSHFKGGGQASSASKLTDAYKALGVSEQSTDQEIKRAYRKLMSQYHPDKLMGQGVPEDMIAVATEKTKEIQVAYDLIKKSRQQ